MPTFSKRILNILSVLKTSLSGGDDRNKFIKKADSRTKKKESDIVSEFRYILKDNILVYYSQGTRKWIQYIKIPSLKVEKVRRVISKEDLERLLDGKLFVYCNCPAFKWWGYQYICTSRKSILQGKENNIYPEIRNPNLVGSVCKHLIHVLKQLPNDLDIIYSTIN